MTRVATRADAPAFVCESPATHLVNLRVEAWPCPQVHLRVLGLLALQDVDIHAMRFLRHDDGITIECAFDPLEPGRASTLLAKIEAILMVREADIGEMPASPTG